MKKQIASVLLLAMLAVFVLGAAPHAFAATETSDIFLLEEKSHMMVTVGYTAEVPAVFFLSPDGTAYDDTAVAEGKMHQEKGENVLVFRIPNAAAGQWKIVYDKGTNEKLDISWAPYVEAITVQSFSYEVKTDAPDRLEAKLAVSYYEDCWYSYRIYAALKDENNQISGTRELCDGTGKTNETAVFTVNISQLPTYDQYYLMAEVAVDDNGTSVTDSFLGTTVFSYTNADMPEAMKGVRVEIDVTDGALEMNWSDFAVSCSGYVLGVYADDVSIYANTFDSSTTVTRIPIDLNAAKLSIRLGYTTAYSSNVSELLIREINMSHAKAVTVETGDYTADSRATIRYDFSAIGGDVNTVITVNDKNEEHKLSGSNSITAALELFDNKLCIQWYTDPDTCFTVRRSIYYDNIAPNLHLPEISGNVTTEQETYILTGYTDAGCKVTVNDNAVEINADGTFQVELELPEAVNTFTVAAVNANGISAVKSFSVIRVDTEMETAQAAGDDTDEIQEQNTFLKTLLKFAPLIMTGLLGLALIPFTLCGPRAFERRKTKKGMLSAILWLCGFVLSYVDIVLACITGWRIWRFISDSRKLDSIAFFDAADTSVSEAYHLLERNTKYKETMVVWIWVLSGVVLLTVALFVLAAILKKKDEDLLPTEGQNEPEEPVFEKEEPEIAQESSADGENQTPSAQTEMDEILAYVDEIEAENKPDISEDPEIAEILELIEDTETVVKEPAAPAKVSAAATGGMKPLDMDNLDSDMDEPEHQALDLPGF